MKKLFSLMTIAIAFTFTSCSDDDNQRLEEQLKGKNTVVLDFDNGIAGKSLELGKPYTNANKETITIESLDYIVGNFVLTNQEGRDVKVDGFHIISKGGKKRNGDKKVANSEVKLPNIPAGKYTKIKFGVGVDKETFKAQTEQYKADGNAKGIDFWIQAKKYALVWQWTSGYKFTQFEGKYTSATQKEEKQFMVHIANKGNDDLYREVELNIADIAIVSNEVSPQLHIMVDADKILNGAAKIKLSEGNDNIHGGGNAEKIANNISKMFMVHHVHNDGNHHN